MSDLTNEVILTKVKKIKPKNTALTETEKIIAKLRYCDELSQKAIAEKRGCALRTVEQHCFAILKKLGVGKERSAVKKALKAAKVIKGKPYV